METQISERMYQAVSEFSKTAEKILAHEIGDLSEKENLRDTYARHLAHFVRKDAQETDPPIDSKLCEMVTWNTRVAGDRLYASWYMHVHIEPILALANECGAAGLQTESDETMMVYNFALGMRRLYRKMSETTIL